MIRSCRSRQTNINEGITLVTNGLMSKKRFLVDKLGYTEDEAVRELKEIGDEKSVSGDFLDVLEMGGTE